MRLCSDSLSAADALENLGAVVSFLGAALTAAREEPWEDMTALWGAQIVFITLAADMEELRDQVAKS